MKPIYKPVPSAAPLPSVALDPVSAMPHAGMISSEHASYSTIISMDTLKRVYTANTSGKGDIDNDTPLDGDHLPVCSDPYGLAQGEAPLFAVLFAGKSGTMDDDGPQSVSLLRLLRRLAYSLDIDVQIQVALALHALARYYY